MKLFRQREIRRLNLWSIMEQKKRYSKLFLKYSTKRKVLNGLRILHEMYKRAEYSKSKPFAIKIEPTNICNLRCIGCSTGRGDNPVPKGKMSFDLFSKIIDTIGEYLFIARLDGQGEPLFNKEIFRMLGYAHRYNIGTVMSTNFTLFEQADIEELIKSGLDHLIISMDGITPGTYQIYRKAGDLEKIKENIQKLIETKKKLRIKHPFIELQFLFFEHNRHEIELAREYASRVEVDRFIIVGEKRAQKPKNPKTCYWLWGVLTVGWNGDYKPCCFGFDNTFSLGNIRNEKFDNTWNNHFYQNIRRTLFVPGKSCSEFITHCPFNAKTR